MTEQIFNFESDFLVPPGETLLETIEELGISQAELALRTGRPTKTINEIIKGTKAITAETALQFEKVLGVPASFWNNLEANYREGLAREKERENLEEKTTWLKEFPIKELVKKGWLRKCQNDVDQLRELLTYFGVASIETWEGIWEPKVAFRKAENSNPGAIAAWVRKAEIIAQSIKCEDYNEDKFKHILEECRKLTNESDPQIFMPKLIELCSSAGVSLVFLQELPGCKVSGATKWLHSNKAMIALSARYKSNDHLWFTFFHEVGHIILHGKKLSFIEGVTDEEYNEKEEEANKFAANFLIPTREYSKFTSSLPISRAKVLQFSRKINIAPGVIVGRLQKDGLIQYSHLNDLKQYYKWKS